MCSLKTLGNIELVVAPLFFFSFLQRGGFLVFGNQGHDLFLSPTRQVPSIYHFLHSHLARWRAVKALICQQPKMSETEWICQSTLVVTCDADYQKVTNVTRTKGNYLVSLAPRITAKHVRPLMDSQKTHSLQHHTTFFFRANAIQNGKSPKGWINNNVGNYLDSCTLSLVRFLTWLPRLSSTG